MPQDIRSRWWWLMPPDRLRAALALYDSLKRSGGTVVVDFHTMSTALRTSRSTIIRALDELEQRQLIHTKATAGRTGGTEVAQIIPDWFADDHPAQNFPPTSAQNSRPYSSGGDSAEQFHGSIPEQFHQPVLDLPNPTKNSDPDPSLDLFDRPPTPETEEQRTPGVMNEPTEPTNSNNPQGRAKRSRIDPAKIPPPAWRAADGLRDRILKYNPDHRLAAVAWGSPTGLRAKWAHELDLMNRIDRRDWGEIGGVIRWLYPDDAAVGPTREAAMFVIQSPDSLREKFDRVQAARRKTRTEPSSRTPDTRQPPAFKSWGGS